MKIFNADRRVRKERMKESRRRRKDEGRESKESGRERKEKERHIFCSLCEGSPTIPLSECMSLLECELTCVNKPFPSSDQFLRASHRVKISPN